MPFPCHAVPLGLECVFPDSFTQCGRVWFTLSIPRQCHALTMPFFSRPRHSTAVERRPVGYVPAFGFFRLPRGVPRKLLSEAYQSSQQSIPMTVKSGSSTLQKKDNLINCCTSSSDISGYHADFHEDTALSEHGRGAAWHVWINCTAWQGNGMGTACFVWIGLKYVTADERLRTPRRQLLSKYKISWRSKFGETLQKPHMVI
jgi:hypothetical protein